MSFKSWSDVVPSPYRDDSKFYDPEKQDRTGGEPPDPEPGSWGMQPDGSFKHPELTPMVDRSTFVNWTGQLAHRDTNTYAENTTQEAFYPLVINTAQTWQAIYDMDGRRYMLHHYRTHYCIYDITDPRDLKVIVDRPFDWANEHPFGPTIVCWNEQLGKLIMITGYEPPRYGVIANKWLDPESASRIVDLEMLRGFRIFEMTSPTEWTLLSEMSTDPSCEPGDQLQQGSGVVDLPVYFGDRYLFVATAPDATFSNQPYRSVLYTNGHVAFDVSDPTQPKRLSTWWVQGSRSGEELDSPYYVNNPRWNNQTSWFGARMGLCIPRSVEDGGRYGYAPMGGLGFFVIDISDPSNLRQVGHLALPMSVAGTEGDNVDVSSVEETGYVYLCGYPMNNDCYEPEKFIYQIDVRDPENPKLARTLPRPKPPKEAPFTDYAQRRGSFGPKRAGYYNQPGVAKPGIMPYAYYNAGLQIFDVTDPEDPKIGGYFVPPMGVSDDDDLAGIVHGTFVEWDRNLIWIFCSFGIYCVSSPMLGEPVFGLPGVD